MVSVDYGQGRIQGGRMMGMQLCILPPAIFKNAFDVSLYNFFIISNFFDSDKPYALRTYNRKCVNKMRHIWQSTQNLSKKCKQNLCENCSKSNKIAITACKLFKIFLGEHASGRPYNLFCFSISFKLVLSKRNVLEKMEN